MKSRSRGTFMLGIAICAMLESRSANAGGMLEGVATKTGTVKVSVTTSGAGDSFNSIAANSARIVVAGALDNGNGTTRGFLRGYTPTGAIDTTWRNGAVRSPTSAPKQYVQAVVLDSQQRYVALCGDRFNVWLVRFLQKGDIDGDFGLNAMVLPFGQPQSLQPVAMRALSDGSVIVVAQTVNANGDPVPGVYVSKIFPWGGFASGIIDVAPLSYVTDIAADPVKAGDFAVVGQSNTADLSVMTMTATGATDGSPPFRATFTDKAHYAQFPATYGAGVTFDAQGRLVVAGGVNSKISTVAGVKIPIRRYTRTTNPTTPFALETGASGIISIGSAPQSLISLWKIAPVNTSTGISYEIAGTSTTGTGANTINQIQVVKTSETSPFTLDATFGTGGETHIPGAHAASGNALWVYSNGATYIAGATP